MAKKYEGPAIGIDLGTTYSCVAVWNDQNNRAEIIHNDQGNKTTPSFVAFTNDQRLIGEAAKNQAASNPTNIVFAFMRTKQTLIAADAKRLFNLSIRCAPRGLPFHVCFSIDADGILKVSAEEETSGNKKDITITNENGRLSREEIERMIQEAEHFKSEDMKHVKKARAMRALDDYVYNMKKIMNDNSVTSKLTAVDKVKINSSIVKGEELIDDEDHETFVLLDVLRELESIFESAMKKINKGYSNDESDSDS
ncbi:unnamed protein product [Vicia faba]|uniref:Uncharacterized protein n=1 Tax=Vicia faba TaxID=3906 RepID=A0AAV0YKW4_VICFA|nr:unnamed protein product [Vicia faba]